MSLVTAAEARAHIPALTGSADDARVTLMIARVEADFARLCGYPRTTTGVYSLESASYVIELAGDGGRDLFLPVRPLTAVASVYDDPTLDYTSAVYLVASGDYTRDEHACRLRLLSTAAHPVWSTYPGAIRVACTGGYTTAPAELKELICEGVRHRYDMDSRQGKASTSQGGRSEQYRDEEYPAEVLRALGGYWVPGRAA